MKKILSLILALLMTFSIALNFVSCDANVGQGENGEQGSQGEAGADGLTPFIGANGNWWIGDKDTGVRAEGVDGKDGKTPTVEISEDGFWVINGEKTEHKAVCDHAASASSLDDIAWETLSYREIFIENNKAYVDGFNQNSYDPFKKAAGSNSVSADKYYSYPYSLKAFGTSSQQLVSSATLGQSGNYFVASKVYCKRYVKGELGVHINDVTVGVCRVTYDFVTQADIVYSGGGENIYIGSIRSANLDGYVDDPAVVDMSIFTVSPTVEQMIQLYETYVAIEKSIPRDDVEIPKTEEQMYSAFMDYMSKKAEIIGMNNSNFKDAVGAENTSTAYDFLRLMVYADANYPELKDIWGESSKTISVMGSRARQKTLTSSVIKADLENYYHILGGKTGTIDEAINLAVILEIPGSLDRLAVVVFYAEGTNSQKNNRFEAARQVADAALLKYSDPTYDNSRIDVCCESAVACLIPAYGADMNDLKILYSKNENLRRAPASLTKILTVICALDFKKDLQETVSYSSFDVDNCFWYYNDFYEGDKVTFKDMLYAVFLPSSNPSAVAVARIAGKAILEKTN